MEAKLIATVGQPTIETKTDPKIWGETYGFWCQTLVLLSAAIFAYVAIVSARRIERKRAAMEALFDSKKDEELTIAIRLIATLHDGDKNIASFGKPENIDSPESKGLRYALNHYES